MTHLMELMDSLRHQHSTRKQVSTSGSVVVEKLMEIERYSHVMHISSTVTGQLLPELDAWDALRAALPAGTVSGAPKVCCACRVCVCVCPRRACWAGV
jgi:anthranilate synthase component 1